MNKLDKKFGRKNPCSDTRTNEILNKCKDYMMNIKKYMTKDVEKINMEEIIKNKIPEFECRVPITNKLYEMYMKSTGKKEYEISFGNVIKYINPDGKNFVSGGSESGEVLINMYKCINILDPEIDIVRFGPYVNKNITKSGNRKNFYQMNNEEVISTIKSIPKKYNKILCISLLSPTKSGTACTDIKKGVSKNLGNLGNKHEVMCKEGDIVESEMSGNNEDFVVISFPISSKNFLIDLELAPKTFKYSEYQSSLRKSTKLEQDIYKLIDIDEGQKTFESIAKIGHYYFKYLRHDTTLLYHCRSNKDRNSIFDSVIQATIYYLQKKIKEAESLAGYLPPEDQVLPKVLSPQDFDEIKKLSQKFLLCGLFIAFYGTGFIGIKLDTIPVAKHILGKNTPLYNFYKGMTGGDNVGSSS